MDAVYFSDVENYECRQHLS